jgi:hypothetical protein
VKVFISYPHIDDALFSSVTQFSSHLANELRIVVPTSQVILDGRSILAGDSVSESLERLIVEADVFVPLLAPAWLASPWCRHEYDLFLRSHGAHSRILPVLWATTHFDKVADDPGLKKLADAVYVDWRELRHERWGSRLTRRAVAGLADRISHLGASDRP